MAKDKGPNTDTYRDMRVEEKLLGVDLFARRMREAISMLPEEDRVSLSKHRSIIEFGSGSGVSAAALVRSLSEHFSHDHPFTVLLTDLSADEPPNMRQLFPDGTNIEWRELDFSSRTSINSIKRTGPVGIVLVHHVETFPLETEEHLREVASLLAYQGFMLEAPVAEGPASLNPELMQKAGFELVTTANIDLDQPPYRFWKKVAPRPLASHRAKN